MQLTITHVIAVVGSLVTCIGILWKVIDHYAKRERTRNDENEQELKRIREDHVGLLIKLAEVHSNVSGQREMSEKVLNHITELNNNAANS